MSFSWPGGPELRREPASASRALASTLAAAAAVRGSGSRAAALADAAEAAHRRGSQAALSGGATSPRSEADASADAEAGPRGRRGAAAAGRRLASSPSHSPEDEPRRRSSPSPRRRAAASSAASSTLPSMTRPSLPLVVLSPRGGPDGHSTLRGSSVTPSRTDWWDDAAAFWLPLGLFLLAVAMRFYRIDLPRGVVFDESHFGRFTGQYSARQLLFDIHPPLGKLVFYWVGLLTGYDYTKCSYVNITDVYGEGCHYLTLRFVSATFGAAIVPVVYWIARGWSASPRGAALAALLLNFDMLNLMESRYILMDSQLAFWCAACLLGAQRWWARLNAAAAAEARFAARYGVPYDDADADHAATDGALLSGRARVVWLLAVGALCGLAVSVKWTGLATPGMVAIESFFGVFFLRQPVHIAHGAVVAAAAFAVYAACFYAHFWVGSHVGDGAGFMPAEFQRTLIGGAGYDPAAPRPWFLASFYRLNHEMLFANARINVRHAWETLWWEWILNLRGLLYYSKDAGHSYTNAIYLLGNPAVIWLCAGGVAASALLLLSTCRCRRFGGEAGGALAVYWAALDKWGPLWRCLAFCLCAYVANLAPYTAVARSCFIYHYMPGLLYAELATALLIDALAGRRWMPAVFRAVLAPVVAVFAFYAPWIYLYALTNDGHDRRRWLPRWN